MNWHAVDIQRFRKGGTPFEQPFGNNITNPILVGPYPYVTRYALSMLVSRATKGWPSWNLLDNQFIVFPYSTGNPERTVDKLGIALVGRLDGGEHAENVSSRVNVLGLLRTEQGIENVTWSGKRPAGAQFETITTRVSKYSSTPRDQIGLVVDVHGWRFVHCLQHESPFDDADRSEASGLT
jgi:hypothetical protein